MKQLFKNCSVALCMLVVTSLAYADAESLCVGLTGT